MSSSAYGIDPDDKEIGDEDDNDRNHKHRKRRGSKPFPNGYIYRETGSQSNETWKKYRFNPLEKDISMKFDQKRPGFTQYSRGPSDLNQKTRINQHQPFSGDLGAVRDRGRDFSLWSQHDPRFSSVDISSQIIQQGSVPHSLFARRGLPTVSNSHGSSWSPFGMVPGIPNGGLDMLHPAIKPSLSMGLSRQRCRDFEEKGFCLKGDMCPMEHGVNRIVVEDVQSLSQFNLPISLSSANVKCGMGNNGQDASAAAAAADFYDPDQPLWDSHTSTGTQSISQPNVGKNDSLLDHGLSGDHRVGLSDGSDNELVRYLNPQSSVHGKITRKKRTEIGKNMISIASTSNFMHDETMKSLVSSNSTQDPPRHQKMNNLDSSLKIQSVNGRMLRKPSQKAQHTLFVNGIPQQNNRRETILSHFKKFGEVSNIYIPLNSERAFVQFSKKEEAEAALLASDAVMGNRFIKLWWANRDKIQDNEAFSGHSGLTVSSVSPYISVANKRKDDPQSILHNDLTAPAYVSVSDHPKHVVSNGPKVTHSLQKKLDSLEVLKEEIRKKQEILDQKRNDFRLKLDKLATQATGLKGEVAPEPVAKKQKVEVLTDSAEAATPSSRDCDEVSKSVDPCGPQNAKTTLALGLQESSSLRSSPHSLVHVGSPVVSNRFKLDNRPTAFKIVPPLPDGLADVPVLKEHFSPYGDLSKVQLDHIEGNTVPKTSTVSACIYFTTRHAAEKAFMSCKSWKGHTLQFVWLINSSKYKTDSSKTTSQKPSTSEDRESEKPKGTDIVKDHIQPNEIHHSTGALETSKP